MNTDRKSVVKTYSGRAGCMCGCRGNWLYAEDASSKAGITRNYNKVMNHPNVAIAEGANCAYVMTKTHTYAVYFGE